MKKLILTCLCLLIIISVSYAANNYPYSSIVLKTPGVEDPFPGLGNYYSGLNRGIDTVMWNPASLAKINKLQASLGLQQVAGNARADFSYNTEDSTFEVGSSSGFSNAILFSSDPNATVATREWTGLVDYATLSSGMTYGQGIRINDFLSFGMTARGDSDAAINIAGEMPVTYRADIDIAGISDFLGSGITITPDNKLTYTHDIGGVPYTYTSEASVWSGFIDQNQRTYFTTFTEARNNINVKANTTLTGAANWGGLAVGLNMTPISATANFSNTAKMVVNSDNPDMYVYIPDFDANNPTDVANWTTDKTKYPTEAGYTKRYIRVPAGESVVEAKYNGFYSASGVRMDLGATYDTGPATWGIVLENASGTNLDFQGTGRVAYVNTRISTSEPTGLLDPGATTIWEPFSDEFSAMQDTENIGMEAQKNIPLPKKLRFGVAIAKPVILALDYESQLNPIKFRAQDDNGDYTDYEIKNINMIRVAVDLHIIKGSSTLLMKPTVDGVNANTQSSIDSAFRFGVLPVKLDLGSSLNLWGYKTTASTGFSAMSIFEVLQLNTLSADLNKLLYYGLQVDKDNWTVAYQATIDPGATAASYANRAAGQDFSADNLKWISTLKFTCRI